MIRLDNFSMAFDEKILLKDINDTFQSSALTALIGRNGTGKSTLLKAICGLNDRYSGEIYIEHQNLKKIPNYKLAKIIAYVNTQRPRIANLKCKDIVALGRSPHTGWQGKISHQDEIIIEKALEMVGMENYKNRNLNSLSDGESQKIMIARAIAQDTKIIVLDEPTSFLDLPTRFELVSLLKRLTSEEKKTILFSTHELEIALKFADYIALFATPKLINLPTPEFISGNYISDIFPNLSSF